MSEIEAMYLIPKELFDHLIQNANNVQKKNITNLNVKQLNNFESENEHVNIQLNEGSAQVDAMSTLTKPKKRRTSKQKKVSFKPQTLENVGDEKKETQESGNHEDFEMQVDPPEFNNQITQTNQPQHSLTQTERPTFSHFSTQTNPNSQIDFSSQFTPEQQNAEVQALVRPAHRHVQTMFRPRQHDIETQALMRPKHRHASTMFKPAVRSTGIQNKRVSKMKNAGTQDDNSISIGTQAMVEPKESKATGSQTIPSAQTASTNTSRIGSVTIKRSNKKPLRFSDWLRSHKRRKNESVSKKQAAVMFMKDTEPIPSTSKNYHMETAQTIEPNTYPSTSRLASVQVKQNRASTLKMQSTASKVNKAQYNPYETPKQRKYKSNIQYSIGNVEENKKKGEPTKNKKQKSILKKPSFKPYETPKQRKMKNIESKRNEEIKRLAQEAKDKPTLILPKSVKRKYAADHTEPAKKHKNKHSILGYKRRSLEPIRRMVRRKQKKVDEKNTTLVGHEGGNGNGTGRKNGNDNENGNGNNIGNGNRNGNGNENGNGNGNERTKRKKANSE